MIDLNESKPTLGNKLKEKLSFFKNKNCLFYYVLLLLITGIGFYFLMLIENNFVTPYSGDYTMQYIPFAYNYHDDWWTFFRTGTFPWWDSNIFLGADTVTSDGYYIMFSPFFIPLIFTPRSLIPQMLAIISIARTMLAGLFFYYFLKKMQVSETFSRLGGLAYAFCGWMAYYQWFNNFLDIVVFMPLVLLGIEKILRDKKPWFLALFLGLVGIDNFFFFPSVVFLSFIYAMFRFFQRIRLNNWKNNLAILGIGFIAYVVAITLSLGVFYPGLITGLSDPKIEGTSYLTSLVEFYQSKEFGELFKHLFSWNSVNPEYQQYTLYPIMEMFIIPITNRFLTLTKAGTFDNMAGSLWVAMPIQILIIPAIISCLKEKKFSVLVGVALFALALFTPAGYYLLFGGAKSYCRWNIIYPACVITFVIIYLDKHHDNISSLSLVAGLAFEILGISMAYLIASNLVKDENINYEWFVEEPALVLLLEIVYALLMFLIYLFRNKKRWIKHSYIYVAAIEAIVIGTLVTNYHGYSRFSNANGGLNENAALSEVVAKINNEDKDYFRTYSNMNIQNISNNNQNINNYNGTAMFNTLYNYNTKYFKWWSRWSDWTGGWSATYDEKRGYLDYFLGIKYYLINTKYDISYQYGAKNYNVPLGYSYSDKLSTDAIKVFVRDDTNQFAFSFDKIFAYSDTNTSDIFTALTGGDYNQLRNDISYLNYGIISNTDYKDISDEVKADLEVSNLALSISSASNAYGFRNLSFNEYSEGSAGVTKKYYEVSNALKYPSDKFNEIENEYTPLTQQEVSDKIKDKTGNFIIILKSNTDAPLGEFDNGSIFYIKAPYTLNYKVDIFLLDKEGNVITADNHSDASNTNSSKTIRAFYSDEPVYSVVFRPRYYGVSSYQIFYETGANYFSNLANAASNAVNNVEYVNANTFRFTTNYDKYRYITTTIPYERGWSIKARLIDGSTKEIKTYLSQGGFVGFVGEKGEVSYEMTYMNPEVKTGIIFTLSSLVVIFTSYLGYVWISRLVRKED